MLLPVLPELATLHRWCKYQAPSRKICFALGFHSLVAKAFARMASTAADDDQQEAFETLLHVAGNAQQGADLGIDNTARYQQLKRTRFRYASSFMNDPASLRKMIGCLMTVKLCDDISGFCSSNLHTTL